MKKVKEYPDPKNTVSYAYAVTRGEWENCRACDALTDGERKTYAFKKAWHR